MQGLSHLHKIWDELLIVPSKSQKTSDFSHVSQGMPLLDGLYLALIGGYSLGRHDVPQVGDLLAEQLTLGQFEH